MSAVSSDKAVEPMDANRAAYFIKRFKHEEKMLGPNEQAACDFVLAMLATTRATEGAEMKESEYIDLRPVNTEHPLFERIWQAIKGWDIQRSRSKH